MRRPTEEQLFDRYRRKSDIEALGHLFDRTAPALLRVALHVAPDPATAEDLVQATFLKAIESADGFRAGSPVLPWLVGILRHEALQRRWRDGRTPDPARVRCPAPQDPETTAQERELSEALDAAIAELPEQYRSVLWLRLGYGHHSAQIAHALERSPGTVRSQLARGLELLRRKLPGGFATAPGVAVLPQRGLATVKRAVLEHAQAHVGTVALTAPAAAFAAGALIMKKTLVVAVVVLVATGLWVYWPANEMTSLPTPAEPSSLVAGESAITSLPGKEERVPLDPARSAFRQGGVLVVRDRHGYGIPKALVYTCRHQVVWVSCAHQPPSEGQLLGATNQSGVLKLAPSRTRQTAKEPELLVVVAPGYVAQQSARPGSGEERARSTGSEPQRPGESGASVSRSSR